MSAGAVFLAIMALLEALWLAVRSHIAGTPDGPTVAVLVGLSLASGVAVALLPRRAAQTLGRGLSAAARSDAAALGGLAVAALAAGLASAWTQQPFSWDERLVFDAARIAAERGPGSFFTTYAEIPWLGRNHPPLAVLIYAVAMRLVGPDLFALRLVAVAFGVATTLLCFAILRRLLGRDIALLAALTLLSSPLYNRMCSAAMNDVVVTFFFVCAVRLALRLARQPGSTATTLWLGVALGAGMLTKYTMVVAYPVVVAVLWAERALLARWRELAIAVVLSLAMLAIWLVEAADVGALEGQRQWVSFATGRATSSASGARYALDGLFTKLPSGLGVYNLPALVAGAATLLARRDPAARLLALWVGLVCAPLLLTLPDNRYFLPAYPALAAVVAIGVDRLRAGRVRVLLLAWLLCAVTLAYYARVDLSHRAFLFRWLFPGH